MKSNSNEINEVQLDPIVIFEGHRNPQSSLTVLNNLPPLLLKGYAAVSLEFDARRSLDNVIDGLSRSISKANEGINILSNLYGITPTTPIEVLTQLIDQTNDFLFPNKKLYKEYILRKAAHEAKLELLKCMQSNDVEFFGVDKPGVDSAENLSIEELLRINEEREEIMVQNLASLCEKFNGKVIFIFGAGHYGILQKLAISYPEIIKKFHIISFVMLRSNELNCSFKKLQEKHGNTIDEIDFLSTNMEKHTLILDDLDQPYIDNFVLSKLNSSTNQNMTERTSPLLGGFSLTNSMQKLSLQKKEPIEEINNKSSGARSQYLS